ncbi:two-component system, OmpR family, sensor histidine kinase NblS [Thermostichus sp. MS-CIW-37]
MSEWWRITALYPFTLSVHVGFMPPVSTVEPAEPIAEVQSPELASSPAEPLPGAVDMSVPTTTGISMGSLRRWWARWKQKLRLETQLLFVATLVVSLVVSSFTFWAVSTVQQDARFNEARFGRDLGLLLAANVAPLIAEDRIGEVAQLSRQYFESTSSIRYLLYADPEGNIYYGIPFSNQEVKTSLSLTRRMQLPDNRPPAEGQPLVRTHLTPAGRVTDIFVGIYHQGRFLGTLGLGINPNPALVRSTQLAREVSIGVFLAVWVLAILGSVVNALTITYPIKELVKGVQEITKGNFKQRIDLPFGGELAQLIDSFNEMAERLQSYEEQNIEELAAAKAKLETLVFSIVDAAILLDAELRVLLLNPAASRMFGWEGDPVLGKPLPELLPEDLRQQLARPLMHIARGDQEAEEVRVNLTGPTKRVIRILLSPVSDPRRQNLKGIVMTVQDITREAELNEAKAQFISNISHELRTPLFSIKSFIETLYEYGEQMSPAERQDYLEIANRETDRLTRLVNDVLDLSRLESGKQYHFEGVDISAVIEQTLRTHHLQARDKGIQLRKFVDPDLPLVWGNYDLLLQVMTNLLGNALKFTPSGGLVTVHAHLVVQADGSPQAVRVAVADTGIGIAPEDQERIFDRFFRVENRVHTLEGTGLGLAIVRNILEKHHTCIRLESKLEQGSTFWFDLHLYAEGSPLEFTDPPAETDPPSCAWREHFHQR